MGIGWIVGKWVRPVASTPTNGAPTTIRTGMELEWGCLIPTGLDGLPIHLIQFIGVHFDHVCVPQHTKWKTSALDHWMSCHAVCRWLGSREEGARLNQRRGPIGLGRDRFFKP